MHAQMWHGMKRCRIQAQACTPGIMGAMRQAHACMPGIMHRTRAVKHHLCVCRAMRPAPGMHARPASWGPHACMPGIMHRTRAVKHNLCVYLAMRQARVSTPCDMHTAVKQHLIHRPASLITHCRHSPTSLPSSCPDTQPLSVAL